MTIDFLKRKVSSEEIRLWPVVLLLLLFWPGLSFPGEGNDQSELHRLRQNRREASRQLQSAKNAFSAPAQFGLLVIPVDFSDTRLPADWSSQGHLSNQLFGIEGETMENYFRVASDGKLELQITIAPLVHLQGARVDYSDIGWHGFFRTRILATEAITAVTQLGMELRRLDMDGPDGIAGSSDDDGQVDGILILHSGVGQENDTVGGLIQPLQYFIDPPVESGGVQASFYAVASLQSGLGIWAHETGHLLGMEDRYDPFLHPEAGGVDVRSLGGLGRFSLMSSGAWGTGDGHQPALPDAYTCLQLGWVTARRYPEAGNPPCTVSPWRHLGEAPVKVWSAGPLNSEFFLLETRDPEADFPFDAGLARGQMLIYHVDETVPDGWYLAGDGEEYHLRVRLVEADNDHALQGGFDDGRAEDFFPGPLSVTSLTPHTAPDSRGYGGPSNVSIEAITSNDGLVTCVISDSPEEHVINTFFQVVDGGDCHLDLEVSSLANPMSNLTCTLSLSGEGGGEFPDGNTIFQFALTELEGVWSPNETIAFMPPDNPAGGSTTQFHFLFETDGQELPEAMHPWVWLSDDTTFDFNDPAWVFWQQEFPNTETNTRWHLWNQAPFLTADGTAVLACTGEDFPTSEAWPQVQYGRRGRAALISPPLGQDILAIQLTHAVEVEFLHAGVVMDGAAAFWQGPDGVCRPATPLDGWDAVISPQANNSLGGAGVFADSLLILDDNNYPQWRCDVLPLPTTGQGPWRLRLEFSTNYRWRWKGWFVAEMEPLDLIPPSAFPVKWNSDQNECPPGLSWHLPNPSSSYSNSMVEYFDPVTHRFTAIANQEGRITNCLNGFLMPKDFLLTELQPSGLTRHLLRVVCFGSRGKIVSRGIVVFPDDGAREIGYLEQPFPNPSTGNIKFLVEIPSEAEAVLKIYDLRGRLVHSRDCLSGRYQVLWNGADDQGRRLATGTYYLKLEGSGFSSLRKVVLIR